MAKGEPELSWNSVLVRGGRGLGECGICFDSPPRRMHTLHCHGFRCTGSGMAQTLRPNRASVAWGRFPNKLASKHTYMYCKLRGRNKSMAPGLGLGNLKARRRAPAGT
eukprot:58047-Rhodomonas_salina.3